MFKPTCSRKLGSFSKLQGYKQYFIVIRNYKQYFIVIGSKAKVQWLTPVVSALEKLKQEFCEFKASLSYLLNEARFKIALFKPVW